MNGSEAEEEQILKEILAREEDYYDQCFYFQSLFKTKKLVKNTK